MMLQPTLFGERTTPRIARKSHKSDSYDAFVDKFKPKLTTDDCYTPPPVYEAVAGYVAERYNLDRANFARPFYPGLDFMEYDYGPDTVVVDNPPFSILSKIYRYYIRNGIRFFLFAPSLTLFSCGELLNSICYIGAGAGITYENGAVVRTSFATNLETGFLARSCPKLLKIVEQADAEHQKKTRPEALPKYIYPDNVLTAAMLNKYSLRGVEYGVRANEARHVRSIDAQRAEDKTIFGGGFLVSERAAAERAAATRWPLSEREWRIIRNLNQPMEAAI